MRPEIQALRGIAVLTVVVFHLWPSSLPGGFVGVDVFFVISGFLITGQLVREVQRTDRVSLAGFWARRARRILPAALVVLAFCAIATKAIVPETQWREYFAEITASTLYVENWHLAEAAVDYADADDAPSPVRHFWSLSVEEQFYVVWPLLIMLALVWGRRAIPLVLGAVVLVSLVWSILATASDPAAAYFITPTRAWEFGLGGLLALVPLKGRSPALSWAGIAAIALAAVLYSGDTPFPGVAALLPVLGAVAVIAARSFTFRPLELAGDISYSVYLWHWPLIVFAPHAGGANKVLLLVLTFVLGWVSKVVVEDPVRQLRWRPRAILAPAAVATGAVLFLSMSGTADLDEKVQASESAIERVIEKPPPCFGAAAIGDPSCKPHKGVIPTPVAAREARNAPCGMLEIEDLVVPCAFGTPGDEASRTFALIGDSHASHWRAALRPIAIEKGWRGISIARSHCPLAAGEPDLPEPDRSGCVGWREQVPKWLERHPEIDTIFVSQFQGADATDDDFEAMWRSLPDSIERIYVIRDNPQMLNAGKTLDCVEKAMETGGSPARDCRRSRDDALPPDPAAAAAKRTPRAQLIDLTSRFCDRRWCPPVIGGALVYKDANHITSVYGATLAPFLERTIASE